MINDHQRITPTTAPMVTIHCPAGCPFKAEAKQDWMAWHRIAEHVESAHGWQAPAARTHDVSGNYLTRTGD